MESVSSAPGSFLKGGWSTSKKCYKGKSTEQHGGGSGSKSQGGNRAEEGISPEAQGNNPGTAVSITAYTNAELASRNTIVTGVW